MIDRQEDLREEQKTLLQWLQDEAGELFLEPIGRVSYGYNCPKNVIDAYLFLTRKEEIEVLEHYIKYINLL